MDAGKKKVAIALVTLVVVLALAATAYAALAPQQSERANASQSASASSSQSANSSASSTKTVVAPDSIIFTSADDAEAESLALSQIADGRPLLLNFWATWCPYCVDEMDDLQTLYEEYGDEVVFVILNAADRDGEAEKGVAYLEEHGYTFPAYYDLKLNALADYGITGLPTTALIRADGTLASLAPGRLQMTRMRAALDSLVKGA